ncbi:hypothetical protein PVAP13_1KG079454 [Panicum virgatum]|uniref:Uncharacterized protein n=1 Tax=Panicum virgatum TaxID=38727 RepID=A0A8T0XCB6_PANVG|nr:hypothetical protein PVAP13_1KG079454 [Panicum virgatum]
MRRPGGRTHVAHRRVVGGRRGASRKVSEPCVPIRDQQRGPRFAEGAGAKLLRRSEEGAGGLVRRSVEASWGSVASDGSRGGGAAVGEGGVRAAGRVRGDGGGGGAAAGAQRADQDRALRPEESRPQGRPGALGADRGGVVRGGVPRRPARPVPLHGPPRRRWRRQPAPQPRDRVRLFPPRQGMRVHGVRDDDGGAAGVLRGARRRGRPAVEQALQHLHPLLRAGRRGDGLQHARRGGHGRPRGLLRAPTLPLPRRRSGVERIAGKLQRALMCCRGKFGMGSKKRSKREC